jgi:hypothetical protein
MKPIVLALPWYRGMYPHQKNDNLYPYLRLEFADEDWYCCNCHHEGRILRVYQTGLISCPKCESHFMVTSKENDLYMSKK